jgi:polar amino acid transport system permease protein
MSNLSWDVVWGYGPYYLDGLLVTLKITFLTIFFATVIGYFIALMRLSSFAVLRTIAFLYVWFFRGIPELLLMFTLYYATPFGIRLSAFVAALTAMSISSAAFKSEIIRSGIMSVSRGQLEAAEAIGMTPVQRAFRVTLPQAIRLLIPPYMSNCVIVIKGSALVSVITVQDLMFQSQKAFNATFMLLETLGVGGLIYLSVTTIVMIFQYLVERKLKLGTR